MDLMIHDQINTRKSVEDRFEAPAPRRTSFASEISKAKRTKKSYNIKDTVNLVDIAFRIS